MALSMTFEELLKQTVNESLIRIILSKPSGKDADKIKIRPVKVKDDITFQVTRCVGSKESNTIKEIHANSTGKQLTKDLQKEFPENFKQALIETKDGGYTVMAGKKGNITIVRNKTVTAKAEDLSHDRAKNYIISEGTPVPFLVDLGVMTPEGKVAKAKYDKFRQINRYLEFINDVTDKLTREDGKKLTIIDFGCGKSYLTFATYYFLNVIKKKEAHIIGLDLKTDVIKECTRLKNKYGYNDLEFIEGDIQRFEGVDSVDMVITLHACDTATDYALYKAMKWDAKVIMAVPCCQHELNKKIDMPELGGALKYGLIKERMASLMTDAIRANILTENGYDTQVLEFIDMEHTPKNILIRAVKSGKVLAPKSLENMRKFEEMTNTSLTLRSLLEQDK